MSKKSDIYNSKFAMHTRPPSPRFLQMAKRVIKHAKASKYNYEHLMYCPDCQMFPVQPVTGQCGHTRCIDCITKNGACPCGFEAPKQLHVNILIQDIINKMLRGDTRNPARSESLAPFPLTDGMQVSSHEPNRNFFLVQHPRVHHESDAVEVTKSASASRRYPLPPEDEFARAKELVSKGHHKEAVTPLAFAANSKDSIAKYARTMLGQVITILAKNNEQERMIRQLCRTVCEYPITNWLEASDLECVICYQILRHPLTTPCGHSFCRICLDRHLLHSRKCALCCRSLQDFSVCMASETIFLSAAIDSTGALSSQRPCETDYIPIFVCTVAYPEISCPLLIFDPRYCPIIQKVLATGSRKFGMVAFEREGTSSKYGTILEVRDCVRLGDGRSILSTVGVSRFRVLERSLVDGCRMALVERVNDIKPNSLDGVQNLQILAEQISYKATTWLSSLESYLVEEIESTLGPMPQFSCEAIWWDNPQGPKWLWWLIAILPLNSEIQVLMLSTNSLKKRLMAVSRTLDVMDNFAVTRACEVVHSTYYDC